MFIFYMINYNDMTIEEQEERVFFFFEVWRVINQFEKTDNDVYHE